MLLCPVVCMFGLCGEVLTDVFCSSLCFGYYPLAGIQPGTNQTVRHLSEEHDFVLLRGGSDGLTVSAVR